MNAVNDKSYSPVWFTNDRQLDGLVFAYKSSSLLSKIIGRVEMSDDLTSLRGLLMPWMRMPAVMMAQGELCLVDSEISFRPGTYKAFGWRIRGPYEHLSFDLRREDVVSIEVTDFKSPVWRAFDFPFARIRTTRPSPIDNFLVCVGGRLSMPHIRKNTQELQRRLLAWMSPESQNRL
jgi:hypothetical protein